MKYIKTFELITEARVTIPKIKINNDFYHGSIISKGDLIKRFEPGVYDSDAIWFTTDEYIAEMFSKEKIYDEDIDIQIIYYCHIKEKSIAYISYDMYELICSKNNLESLKDYIEVLKEKKYNGWKTIGSIGSHIYDDYALFYIDDNVKITSAKIKIGDAWTDYMSLDEIENIISTEI